MQLEMLASKVCSGHVFADGTNSSGSTCSLSKSYSDLRVKRSLNRVEYRKLRSTLLGIRLSFFADGRIPTRYDLARSHIVPCATRSSETKECSRQSEGAVNISRGRVDEGDAGNALAMNTRKIKAGSGSRKLTVGLADACNFVHNDAKFMNERAKNDIVLLSRGITRLNDRARQDAAVIGNEFRKLDARARKDTEKIDNNVKKRAARLRHIAINLKDRAQSKLKTVADEHWSDGALEADLRRADIIVRRRAMEDAYMALKFVKDIHDMMVNKQLPKDEGSLSVGNQMGYITLERNGKASDLFPGDISMDRITAIQEAYWSMASALSEADGIDYTDPEELELLVATLIDLDAMDGKSSVSLLAECSISPDVNTRKALANALASAPSMWTLGNAGMGALQRLAEDSNSAVATAAANAIDELRRQWEIQEGDSFTFVMNQARLSEDSNKVPFDDDC